MSAVRDEIVARLTAVPGIGVVHPYQRFADRVSDLSRLYAYQGRLQGWYVHRAALLKKSALPNVEAEYVRWQVKGFRSVDDAGGSAMAFEDLLDAILAQFRLDYLAGATEIRFRDDEGEQCGMAIVSNVMAMFAGVLCHCATLELISKQFIRREFDPRCPY